MYNSITCYLFCTCILGENIMSNNINKTSPANSFYNILPSKMKRKDEYTKSDIESFSPPAGKGWVDTVEVTDFFPNPTDEQKKMFPKKWVQDVMQDKTGKKENDVRDYLTKNGYTKEEAEANVVYSIKNALRVKDTALSLESRGKIASLACNVTIFLGFLKTLFNLENNPWAKTIVNFAYGISRSVRSFF